MKIKEIFVLKEAVDDLERGKNFYNKKSNILGNYFWNNLLSDIEMLSIYGGIHKKEYGLYRMLSKRFPYAIYYTLKKSEVYVVAVLPLRRAPQWIKNN